MSGLAARSCMTWTGGFAGYAPHADASKPGLVQFWRWMARPRRSARGPEGYSWASPRDLAGSLSTPRPWAARTTAATAGRT